MRARGYSDNVVEFMAGRLRQLPAGAQPLLHRAACVGNAFSLETLALISHQEASEVERGLEPALQEGLIVQRENRQLLMERDFLKNHPARPVHLAPHEGDDAMEKSGKRRARRSAGPCRP